MSKKISSREFGVMCGLVSPETEAFARKLASGFGISPERVEELKLIGLKRLGK